MATLTLKRIPDTLYGELRRSAAEARRSLNSEVFFRLEASLAGRRRESEEQMVRARAVRHSVGHPVTAGELRLARSAGRAGRG